MANEDFEQKKITLDSLFTYDMAGLNYPLVQESLESMIRACWTEQIHYAQNVFLNLLTKFILKFFRQSQHIDARNLINDILLNLLNHA